MSRREEVFWFSTGDDDEEYGLYIMEINCRLHRNGSYLMYYFDGDQFLQRGAREKELFVPASDIKLVKDEFGNEYIGDALLRRLQEGIKAYRQELPGYLAYHDETEELLKDEE